MPPLGTRIRELRINRNLTLEQVSAETGLSVSFLSTVERNKASISAENLEKLAAYYKVQIVHFFNTPEENSVMITRREQILASMEERKIAEATVTLLANKANARIEPLLVTIAPGKEEPHFRMHEADVLLYVISGAALLISERGDSVELHQGDLAYYVNYPHRRLANASQEQPLIIICITAPPTSSLDDLIGARQGSMVMSAKKK